MLESQNEAIIRYFLKFMLNKKHIIELLKIKETSISKSQTISNLIKDIENDKDFILTRQDITEYARDKFLPHLYNIDKQKNLITSGALKNHSWNRAAPSRLHLTFQKWVRSYLKGSLSLEKYYEKVEEVAKQEIYMLTAANITEYTIVTAADSIIPNLKRHGISDVLINDLGYDVKNTHDPKTCDFDLRENPQDAQEWLFDSGDLDRDLKTAAKAPSHMGYNRIYVIIEPVSRWEEELEYICNYIQDEIRLISNEEKTPHRFIREKNSREIQIHTHLIMP